MPHPYRFPLPKRNTLLQEGAIAQVGGVYSGLLYQLSNSPLLLDAPDSQTSLKHLFLKSSDLSNRIPAYALGYNLENVPHKILVPILGNSTSLLPIRKPSDRVAGPLGEDEY